MCVLIGSSVSEAQVGQARLPGRVEQGQSTPDYREQLLREQYETAVARERAERAHLEHQAFLQECQRTQYEMHLRRSDQEQEYRQNSNQINNLHQAANAVSSIAVQIQMLSSGRRGW